MKMYPRKKNTPTCKPLNLPAGVKTLPTNYKSGDKGTEYVFGVNAPVKGEKHFIHGEKYINKSGGGTSKNPY